MPEYEKNIYHLNCGHRVLGVMPPLLELSGVLGVLYSAQSGLSPELFPDRGREEEGLSEG